MLSYETAFLQDTPGWLEVLSVNILKNSCSGNMSMYLAYKMNMFFYTFFSAKFLVFASLVSDFLTTQTQRILSIYDHGQLKVMLSMEEFRIYFAG